MVWWRGKVCKGEVCRRGGVERGGVQRRGVCVVEEGTGRCTFLCHLLNSSRSLPHFAEFSTFLSFQLQAGGKGRQRENGARDGRG